MAVEDVKKYNAFCDARRGGSNPAADSLLRTIDFMFRDFLKHYETVRVVDKTMADALTDHFFIVFLLETSSSVDEAIVRLKKCHDEGLLFFKEFDLIINDVKR